VDSKRELEEFCGGAVHSFCYPNGDAGDFDGRTRNALQQAGYEMAFTLVEGLNRKDRMNRLELKRIHAHWRWDVFLKLTSGLGDFQNGLKRFRRGAAAIGIGKGMQAIT
jgi:peptidoglycan/xylan/chitin deacetylase (PgdA/CDA1 family)